MSTIARHRSLDSRPTPALTHVLSLESLVRDLCPLAPQRHARTRCRASSPHRGARRVTAHVRRRGACCAATLGNRGMGQGRLGEELRFELASMPRTGTRVAVRVLALSCEERSEGGTGVAACAAERVGGNEVGIPSRAVRSGRSRARPKRRPTVPRGTMCI